MKPLSITPVRKNLRRPFPEATRGPVVGLTNGHHILRPKPVSVVAWGDTDVTKEDAVTPPEMAAFVTRADTAVARREKRVGYIRFERKFDPKSIR